MLGSQDGISLSIEEKSCGREVSKTDHGCWGHVMASACRKRRSLVEEKLVKRTVDVGVTRWHQPVDRGEVLWKRS